MPFKAALSTVFFVSLLVSFSPLSAQAAADLTCLKNGQGALPFMNEQVVRWKNETPNQYKDRALIQGQVVRLLLLRKSHVQFEVRIGDGEKDLIEVIYNREFGDLPRITPGMQVEACGDYITSNAPVASYPASPDGAILHWVHMNTDPPGERRHEDGFVRLDNVTYGNDPKVRPYFFEWLDPFFAW